MRKGRDGGENEKNEKNGKKKKIKTFLVATNVVASRPPERRLTGTPTARAKITPHPDIQNVAENQLSSAKRGGGRPICGKLCEYN